MKQEFTFKIYFSNEEENFENIMEQTLLNYVKNIIKGGCQNDIYAL